MYSHRLGGKYRAGGPEYAFLLHFNVMQVRFGKNLTWLTGLGFLPSRHVSGLLDILLVSWRGSLTGDVPGLSRSGSQGQGSGVVERFNSLITLMHDIRARACF